MAIRRNIEYKTFDHFQDDLLAVQIETSWGPVVVATMYSPPRRNYLPIGEITSLLQRNCPVVFMADLNANHPALGYRTTNLKGNLIADMMNRRVINFKGPDFSTLVQRKGNPDIVFTNKYDHFNMVILQGELTTSDHVPVILKLATRPIIKETKIMRKYKNADWEQFQEKINNKIDSQKRDLPLTDNTRISKETIDEAINRWMEDIHAVAEETIPKKKLQYYIHPQTSDWLKLLEMKYAEMKDRSNNEYTQDYRRIIRNIQERIKEEAARLHDEVWDKKIIELQEIYNDPKKFWGNIKRFMGNNKAEIPYLLDNRGARIYGDKKKEEKFREIWSGIFNISDEENIQFDMQNERIVNNYIERNEFMITPFRRPDLDRLDPNNYLTKPVTTNNIKSIIRNFKNNKAPGASGINKIILIHLTDKAIERYADILNLTLSMGYFPIILKNGIIILIPKADKDGKVPTNYRPITLLELPGKILERIVNDRLQRLYEENNLYNSHQYGFRKGRGTDMALTKIYEKIAINQKYYDHCNVVCRDISKAFDKVWLNGLKYKLVNTNEIPDILKKILCSYVTDRTAQIKINNVIGPKFELKSGVPQGGILSPNLFIIYTKDLPPPGPNATDIIFADDVTQIIENFRSNRIQLARDTEAEIERINKYERKWKISTNINKFSILSVSKSKPEVISVEGRRINFKNEIKILGLTLKRTGIIKHISDRITMAKNQTKKISRFSKLQQKTKMHLYKALIRPLLEYPVIPIALASKSQLLKIQRVQNKNVKFITRNEENLLAGTMKETHELLNLEAMNMRLSTRLTKTWAKFGEREEAIYNHSMQENNNVFKDHNWWPRAALKIEEIEMNEPTALYVI